MVSNSSIVFWIPSMAWSTNLVCADGVDDGAVAAAPNQTYPAQDFASDRRSNPTPFAVDVTAGSRD